METLMADLNLKGAEQWEKTAAGLLISRLDRISQNLGRLSDVADRASADAGKNPTSYASVVSSLQHDILWGLANMGLDSLVTTAKDADDAKAAADRLRSENSEG